MRCDQYLRTVIITGPKFRLRPTDQLQSLHAKELLSQSLQPFCKCIEQFRSVLKQQTHAGINPGHEHIAWTACLIHTEEPFQPFPVHARPLYMKTRRLGQRRQRLVHTVDDEVCTTGERVLRKIRMHPKMSTVRLIHNQNPLMPMHNLSNTPHI